jgi:hypothetical protein
MTRDTDSPDVPELHEDDPTAVTPTDAAAEPREAVRGAQAAKPAERLQPGWVLSASGERLDREELLARYRRQRGLPEDPFVNGARPVPPPGYRDRIMNDAHAASFLARQQAATAPAAAKKERRTFTLGQTFAISAAMALVAGAGAGVVSARFAPVATQAPAPVLATVPAAVLAPVEPAPQLQMAQAPVTRDTVITKKPISTATLQVEDVTGETNSFIPLALHAEPAGLGTDMLLKISGVPAGAYLTSGHRENDQVWALSLADSRNVKLVVPQAREPEIDLAVAAFEPKTGELAAPVKTMTVALRDVVVEPTSAPPPGQVGTQGPDARSALPGASALPATIAPTQGVKVAVATPETAETRLLISQANSLLDSGSVMAARKAFERAWGNDGSADAAFGIARSYDPLVLASLAKNDGSADKPQAIQWYQRAASGGNPDAAEAIVRLQMKP